MIFSTLLSLPCEGRVLNPLPSPRPFQKGKGCNRPPVLRTASLYGWRTKAVCAIFCGLGPPGVDGLPSGDKGVIVND